ncbi:MAG: WXG100 family type VII secretion target [Oscillospiraceae bacterium]|nr:WXG100 family type VII secretion target [Oscillospiraceae bacterium]
MPNFVHTKVDPDRLGITALNIDDSLRLVDNALSAIDDSLRNTLLPTWSGPASSQFFSQYSADTQSFALLTRALREYNEKLKQAAGIYDNADDLARELVDDLKI